MMSDMLTAQAGPLAGKLAWTVHAHPWEKTAGSCKGVMLARTMEVAIESSRQQAGTVKVFTEKTAGKEQMACRGAEWTL